MLHNALPVVLEPVRNEYRLPVCGFDQIFQLLQLPLMDHTGLAILIIDSAVAHLQELI